jgi:hypothetical protein
MLKDADETRTDRPMAPDALGVPALGVQGRLNSNKGTKLSQDVSQPSILEERAAILRFPKSAHVYSANFWGLIESIKIWVLVHPANGDTLLPIRGMPGRLTRDPSPQCGLSTHFFMLSREICVASVHDFPPADEPIRHSSWRAAVIDFDVDPPLQLRKVVGLVTPGSRECRKISRWYFYRMDV